MTGPSRRPPGGCRHPDRDRLDPLAGIAIGSTAPVPVAPAVRLATHEELAALCAKVGLTARTERALDLAALPPSLRLPPDGRLVLFAADGRSPCGRSPDDAAAVRVFHARRLRRGKRPARGPVR